MTHLALARTTYLHPVLACLVCGWTIPRPELAGDCLSAMHNHICEEHT